MWQRSWGAWFGAEPHRGTTVVQYLVTASRQWKLLRGPVLPLHETPLALPPRGWLTTAAYSTHRDRQPQPSAQRRNSRRAAKPRLHPGPPEARAPRTSAAGTPCSSWSLPPAPNCRVTISRNWLQLSWPQLPGCLKSLRCRYATSKTDQMSPSQLTHRQGFIMSSLLKQDM